MDKKTKESESVKYDMYEKESIILNKVKESLKSNELSKDDSQENLSFLIKSYEKLLKLVKKITKVGDANQRKLLLAYNEIDKQKKELDIAYKKLDLLARVDPLTGLSNRRDFLEKVNVEKDRFEREKREFAFILTDIDNFKSFNDKYGHDCGDFVLKQVAEIIKGTVRKQDSVGRWGGEEFILLLPGSIGSGAIKIAEILRKEIAQKAYIFGELNLSVTMTFGVSVYDGSISIDNCIKAADVALYNGKQKGKNCVVYET